jgi:hypothetical protein
MMQEKVFFVGARFIAVIPAKAGTGSGSCSCSSFQRKLESSLLLVMIYDKPQTAKLDSSFRWNDGKGAGAMNRAPTKAWAFPNPEPSPQSRSRGERGFPALLAPRNSIAIGSNCADWKVLCAAVIPACFCSRFRENDRESSDFALATTSQEQKALDSRQEHAGMTASFPSLLTPSPLAPDFSR